jgi:hypothetical protein
MQTNISEVLSLSVAACSAFGLLVRTGSSLNAEAPLPPPLT